MKKMRLLTVFISPILCVSQAYASDEPFIYEGPVADDYITLINGGDELAAKLVVAYATGILVANASLEPPLNHPLFCVPDNLAITDGQFIDILKRFLEAYPAIGKAIPVEVVMLKALEYTFPCRASDSP